MKGHTNQPKEQKNVTPAVQSKVGKARFADHRTESIAQRKLRKGMSNNEQSPETAQLRKSMQEGSGDQVAPIQRKSNHTGLPENLKSGIENLSGYAMDDVKVHYNSSKPAQLQAYAYAQGSDIHLAPGQEKHLGHEAWHVVQQKQGRVKPTKQLKSKVNINDDAGLEKEADLMGAKAMSTKVSQRESINSKEVPATSPTAQLAVAQRIEYPAHHDPELEFDLDAFFEDLEELIANSDRENAGPFRLIEVEELLRYAEPRTSAAFFRFVAGEDLSQGTEFEQYFEINIKQKFGYDQVEELKERLIGPLGWGNLKFKTRGYVYDVFKSLPWNRTVYDGMVAKYNGNADTQKYLKGLIESGSDAPVRRDAPRTTKFYKLMRPGENFMTSPSSYYLSRAELNAILGGDNLADHLGLPLINYSAVYCVYEIEALVDTHVYESTVAPTMQTIKRTNDVKENGGGRRQTLIIDSNTNNWRKNPTPKYMLDPDEAELLALANFID